MSISEREQQALDSIEDDLAGSGPELAAKLAVFARLTAGEVMPPRESVSRPAGAPPVSPAKVSASPETARARQWLGRRAVWQLLLLMLAIALVALVATVSHGTGKGACPVPWTACQQAHAPVPTPGRSSAGVAGGL